jgi:molybdopterin-guanine dinucleotide biosynthesis protein B
VDWVLVEGFKKSDLLKGEVWRKASGQPVRSLDDDFVVAIATDSPQDLPEATQRPVLDLNDPYAITEWLLANEDRFEYNPPLL